MRSPSGPAALLPLLAAVSAARAAGQDPVSFTIDQAASAWSWAGDTDLGRLEGDPSQEFELAGTFRMELEAGLHPISSGRFVGGGVALVVPDIAAKVPNPVPNLPPLAEVDITGVTLEFTSPAFAIDASGAFTADVTVTLLSGTLTVTPLFGNTTVTDLAGETAGPDDISGTIQQNGATILASSSQSGTFSFTDAGSGLGADIQLGGDLVGQWVCPPPVSYCTSNPNSTGQPALIGWSGSTRLQDDALTLAASQLPVGEFGYFLFSDTRGFAPLFGGSQGNLCLGGTIVRFSKDVLVTQPGGVVSFTPDLGDLPSMASFAPGETWSFQLWHRDHNPGTTSNTTDGLEVVFCP